MLLVYAHMQAHIACSRLSATKVISSYCQAVFLKNIDFKFCLWHFLYPFSPPPRNPPGSLLLSHALPAPPSLSNITRGVSHWLSNPLFQMTTSTHPSPNKAGGPCAQGAFTRGVPSSRSFLHWKSLHCSTRTNLPHLWGCSCSQLNSLENVTRKLWESASWWSQEKTPLGATSTLNIPKPSRNQQTQQEEGKRCGSCCKTSLPPRTYLLPRRRGVHGGLYL